MISKPFFSILIPTYNQVQYLAEALDSVIAQTYRNWEAIIINDGSTDITAETIEIYCNKDCRFKAIYKENGGVASALNRGLEKAQGEWICWLSSDDLFEPYKLEIHREWIENYPDKYFFFSHFKYLNDETGEITNPDLWVEIPEIQWQILEMLKSPFIHGNSICINKKTWKSTGNFDESLRYAQDYDMWLRLLAKNTAIYIPRRTCITRLHPSQDSKKFPEACFYDSSKSGINFLNSHKFSEIVPLVNLSNSDEAILAVDRVLSVATNFDSVLYYLGPHPALIWRVMEWSSELKDSQFSIKVKQLIKTKARQASRKYFDNNFGFIWQAILLACYINHPKFIYNYVSPLTILESNYCWQKYRNDQSASSLNKYLEKIKGYNFDRSSIKFQEKVKEIIFVFHRGTNIDSSIKYGELRAVLEIAKQMQKFGRKVLLTGVSAQAMGFTENILFVGDISIANLLKSLESLKIIDTVVMISEAEFFFRIPAVRFAIYHHSPYPIAGSGTKSQKVNLAKIPIICVSQSSKASQMHFGINPNLIHVIHNGYDPSIFFLNNNLKRLPYSLIFAGTIVSYKGLDIALEAFIEIKKRFPKATLNICGDNQVYSNELKDRNFFIEQYLNTKGFPVWEKIEKEIIGVKYHGELSQEDLSILFNESSLLITPSRLEETFGIVSIEAQACGCIPVLPNKGGFPETIKLDKTGYLYEVNNPQELSNKIIDIWSDNYPSESQRKEVSEWTRSQFSWYKSGIDFLNVLESPQSKANVSLKIKIIYMIREPLYFLEKIFISIKEGTLFSKLKARIYNLLG